MKNNFLIYVLSSLMLGSSLHSIGQKRYLEDSTRMTDSSWCEPHSREDGRVDNLIMVSSYYPLLLIRNNEPVTGIVYTLFPNGNISYEKHYKNGFPIRHEKGWWPNGKLESIIYYSNGKLGYRLPRKEKEWYENGQIKSKVKNYYWGEDGHFLLRKSRYSNGNLEDKTRKWSNRKWYTLKEKEWYENGQIKSKYHGKKNKTIDTSWYENGQVKKKEKWLNNSSTNECWDQDGNKIECD